MEKERDELFNREDERISLQGEDFDEQYRRMKEAEVRLGQSLTTIVKRFDTVEQSLTAGRGAYDEKQKKVAGPCI
jgi:hypothetical protein